MRAATTALAIVLLTAFEAMSPHAYAYRAGDWESPLFLSGQLFSFDNARIDEAGLAMLDDAAMRAQQNPGTRIVIDGHSSPGERGTVAYERARNQRDFLINEKGLEAERIVIRSFGTRYPGVNGEDRRVELYVLPPGVAPSAIRKESAAARAPVPRPAMAVVSIPRERLAVQDGHLDRVTAVAVSPDGRLVATGSNDGKAIVWDVATHLQVVALAGHTGSITAIAFSPDGRVVATTSGDGTASVWDPATGADVRRIVADAALTSLAFSPDSRFFVAGSADGETRIWEVGSGVEAQRFERQPEAVNAVAFSPDGKLVLAGGADARVWNAVTGADVARFGEHTQPILSVAFSPDGKLALTGGDDGVAWLWDAATGAKIRQFVPKGPQIFSVAFTRDGKKILTSFDGRVAEWNAETGAILREFGITPGPTTNIALFPDGRRMLVGHEHSARATSIGENSSIGLYEAPLDATNAASLSADGRTLVSGLSSGEAYVLDVRAGREVRRLRGKSSTIYTRVSRDGRFVATQFGPENYPWALDEFGDDYRIWDATKAAELTPEDDCCGANAPKPKKKTLSRTWIASGPDEFVVLDPEGKEMGPRFNAKDAKLASEGWVILAQAEDGTLSLRRESDGATIQRLNGPQAKVDSIAISPDGRLAAASSDAAEVCVWDTSSGQRLWMTIPEAFAPVDADSVATCSVEFSRDSRYLFVSDSRQKTTFLASTGREMWSVPETWDQLCQKEDCKTPDGRFAIERQDDWTVRVSNAATQSEIWHSDSMELRISPDGRLALVKVDYSSWRVAELATGREKFRLTTGWRDCSFSDDGRFILAGSRDGSLRFVDPSTGAVLARIVNFRDGGWAVLDPAGTRYDGSDGVEGKGLALVANGEPQPSSELRKRFRTPGLLAKLLR